jgi:hypothetical protein
MINSISVDFLRYFIPALFKKYCHIYAPDGYSLFLL